MGRKAGYSVSTHEAHWIGKFEHDTLPEFMTLLMESGAMALCNSFEVQNVTTSYLDEGHETVEVHVQKSSRRRQVA